jgi:hypothetical protein
MAEHRRSRPWLTIADLQVGVADASAHNTHQDLIAPRLLQVHFLDDEWVCLLTQDGGSHTHPLLPFISK